MASEVAYKASVAMDVRHLHPKKRGKVLDDLEAKLAADPRAGEPLSGQWSGLWRLRIDKVRVIYELTAEGVLILRVAKRAKAFR